MLEKDENISEGQAGFTPNRSRVDHVCVHSRSFARSRKGAGLTQRTVGFWTSRKEAYDTARRNGLWIKLWGSGIRGRVYVENGEENDRM